MSSKTVERGYMLVQDQSLPFQGPLFIVGLPRSGTKLLRDLLNRNPQIGIPTAESHFVPKVIQRYGLQPSFDARQTEEFVSYLMHGLFTWNMEKEGFALEKERFMEFCRAKSWPDILEPIFRFYARTEDKGRDFIWGDKTPTYLTYMPLLKEAFPQAKFIHIIRDPRDYCLSMKKAWGKDMYRAAHRWREDITTARKDGRQLKEDYVEVFYEELLENTEKTLQKLCRFLHCDYCPEMTELKRPAENLGDAKGSLKVVSDNVNKFRDQLPPSQIRKIEEIVYSVAEELNYLPQLAKSHRPLSPAHLKWLLVCDAFNLLKFHTREKGLVMGLKYFVYSGRARL